MVRPPLADRIRRAAASHWRPALAASAATATVLAMTAGLAMAGPGPLRPTLEAERVAALTEGDLSEAALQKLTVGMDPAALALAQRFDPQFQDGRQFGSDWEDEPALLQFLPGAEARRLNEAIPFDPTQVQPAAPFILEARNAAEGERAVRCLANAVYYEAALEPLDGRKAVAQVVLNRVRDPNFPNSVCGVVYQGWELPTGCQFSFTCDGALAQAPDPVLWREARKVAVAALNGDVQPVVGTATHYHADYVSPYWAPELTKITQIGAHIFYRWPGQAGLPQAFTAAYTGGEMRLSEAVLTGRAARQAPRPVAAADKAKAPGVKTVQVADASGRVQTRVQATFQPAEYGRRQPTPEEVARINALLDQRFPTKPAEAPAPAAPAATPPTAAIAPVQTAG